MDSTTQFYKLLVLSIHHEIYQHLIEQASLPGLSIVATSNPQQAIESGSDSDLVFGEPSLIRKVMDQFNNIKWIQSSWAGVEPLLAEDLPQDYILTNVRNVYGPLMSEYVFGYILMIERKILSRWISQQKRIWDASLTSPLKNKTIGLLGVGSIGKHIALTARHFGMTVYGYTRQSEASAEVDQYFHGGDIRAFANDLDYLVCTLPGTKDTRHFINDILISALPLKAWVVNIGRGSTVDESALIQALNRQIISGAVLDVFQEEPLPPNHPFWTTPNTFITYHTAAQNNPPDIAAVFIENYKRLIQGAKLLNQVDFELGY